MPSVATWMGLEITMLSEVSQTEKDKYCMILLTHGTWKNDTDELIHKTETDSPDLQNKFMVTMGEGWGEGGIE